MPAALGIAKRAVRATIKFFRFLNRHQWLTSAFILGGTVATLVLWTLLLPIPEAHGAYTIQKSLRFNDDDGVYLNKTLTTTTSRAKWTWSAWVKRGNFGSNQTLFCTGCATDFIDLWNDNTITINLNSATRLRTNALYRDPAAWSHMVVSYDEANGTAANRLRLYVNSNEVTSFQTDTRSSISTNGSSINTAAAHFIGSGQGNLDAYLSDVYFIDGQALDPASFGETDATTGSWKAKAYSGTYGTNGFHLDFTDSATLGNDVSGNNNDWTSNSLDATDQVRDTPTNNFATGNSIQPSSGTFSNGNLNNTGLSRATFLPTTGKWYWEVKATGASAVAGVISESGAASTTSVSNGMIMGFRFDADAGTLATTTDGSSFIGQISGLTNGRFPYVTGGSTVYIFGSGGTTTLTYDTASGGAFYFTPPSGFKALSTANLPTPAIAKPSNYFDAKTYTGNGSTQSIAVLNFQPALTWLKDRTSANSHGLFDAVRGATQWLASNSTAAEATDADTLTAFNADGFSLGADAKFNTSSNNYISWNWKESVTAGSDIVTYTGDGEASQTINHGLGGNPALIIGKARSGTSDWYVGHTAVQGTNFAYYGILNSTAAWSTGAGPYPFGTAGTSAFVAAALLNTNAVNYIAYLFAEVPGYSKFGSYTGNGSTDGPFVYTGFKPRWVMIKRTDSAGSWLVWDTARDPHNAAFHAAFPDLTSAESTSGAWAFDFLSNGFKLRNTQPENNASGGTYIYAAFAESPFKYVSAGTTGRGAYFIAWEF